MSPFNSSRRMQAELEAWQADRRRVQDYLDKVEHYAGFTNAEDPSLPFQLHPGEHALLVVHGASLIAPRRLPGHWVGGNTGVTFRVARGVNYRVGGTRGHYTQGAEAPEVIDSGMAGFTDKRVVFTGTRHAQEWDFSHVLGYHNEDSPNWTAIPVSSRQAVSGVGYDEAHAEEVRFALALGLARYHGSTESLASDLKRQLDELDKAPPPGAAAAGGAASGTGSVVTAPAAAGVGTGRPGAPSPPAGWYPDPSGTARLRWWDGKGWSDHTSG